MCLLPYVCLPRDKLRLIQNSREFDVGRPKPTQIQNQCIIQLTSAFTSCNFSNETSEF